MANVKINDLTLASGIASNMQLETDINGTTANKINISQLTSYFGDNIVNFSAENIIYVAKNGNDSTGDGSFDKPFLTIAAANAAISGASTSNRFLVFIYSGTYAETDLRAKAWTYYVGQGLSTRITSSTNQWQLDLTSGWNSSARGAVVNLVLSGSTGINFDLTSLSNSSAVIDIGYMNANGGLTLSGRPLGADTLQMFNSYFLGASNISNFQGFIKNSFCNGAFNFTASTANVTLDIQSFAFQNLTVTSSGSVAASLNAYCSAIAGTLTLNGAASIVRLDSITHPTSSANLIINDNATLVKLTSSYSINYLNATANLDFATVNANDTKDLTISLTGAALGNVVALGAPVVVSGLSFSAFVSAADTVTVRAMNATSTPIVLSPESFTVKII